MHATNHVAYGAGGRLGTRVLLSGLALTPVTLLGAWWNEKIVGRMSDRVYNHLVEAGLVIAGLLFLLAPSPAAGAQGAGWGGPSSLAMSGQDALGGAGLAAIRAPGQGPFRRDQPQSQLLQRDEPGLQLADLSAQ